MCDVISFLKHIYFEWILKVLYDTYNARPKYWNGFKLRNVAIIYGNPDAVPFLGYLWWIFYKYGSEGCTTSFTLWAVLALGL